MHLAWAAASISNAISKLKFASVSKNSLITPKAYSGPSFKRFAPLGAGERLNQAEPLSGALAPAEPTEYRMRCAEWKMVCEICAIDPLLNPGMRHRLIITARARALRLQCNHISDPNDSAADDLGAQAAAMNQSPHDSFDREFLQMRAGITQPGAA
jgi:hypothetical protein